MQPQSRRDIRLVLIAAVMVTCYWFGCNRPVVDKASPREMRCIEIREELRVLNKALMGHLAFIDASKLPSFDSKQPPQWLTNVANGKVVAGLDSSDLRILRKALNGPDRFRVPAKAVGLDYTKETVSALPLLEADNVPAYCSDYAIGANGFLRREPVEVP